MSPSTTHEKFMKLALKQAQMAFDDGEIPVGAVIVHDGKVIGRGYNQVQKLNDPTAHAEMLAITAACNGLGGKYLPNCTLYVTLEPCTMCAGAIKWAQISTIVFGAYDLKAGFSIFTDKLFAQKTTLLGGILEKESKLLILDFFEELRSK
ncbi:MAG: nucleoside deaminase [Cytophagales bacterium]